MIKLYGLRMSNYYSLVKAVMIEKGLGWEEVARHQLKKRTTWHAAQWERCLPLR